MQQDDGAVVRLGEGGGGDGFDTGRLLAGGFAVPHHGGDVVAGEIPRQAEQFFAVGRAEMDGAVVAGGADQGVGVFDFARDEGRRNDMYALSEKRSPYRSGLTPFL